MPAIGHNFKQGIRVIFCLVLGLSSGTGFAEEKKPEPERFSVSVRNILVGELLFSHQFLAGQYEAEVDFKTKGLAGALLNASFIGEVKGSGTKNGVYTPQTAHYELSFDDEKQSTNLIFKDGILTEHIYEPAVHTSIDPKSQAGAVDPLTAFTFIMRDMPGERLCRINVQSFDGIYSNVLSLGVPKEREDGRFQCNGGITRIAGYTDEEEANLGDLYFTILYRYNRASGTYVVDRIVGQSPYGQYQIVRTSPATSSPTIEELPEIDSEPSESDEEASTPEEQKPE